MKSSTAKYVSAMATTISPLTSFPRRVRAIGQLTTFLLLMFVLARQDAVAQFSGQAQVEDGANCFSRTSLLPQVNPPVAITSCMETYGVTGGPATITYALAAAYPANGMLTTWAQVNANLGTGSPTATANVTDYYFPTSLPPGSNATLVNGGILVKFSLDGYNQQFCGAGGLLTVPCDGNDYVRDYVATLRPNTIQVINGLPPCSFSDPPPPISETFCQSSIAGTGINQIFQIFFPLQCCLDASPTGYAAQFYVSMQSVARCGGFDISCFGAGFFQNTLQVTHADVVDGSGNVIQGATIGTASGFNPNASPQMTFSNFTGKLDIIVRPPSSFDFRGTFTLGSASSGINPPATGLTLNVGTYSVVIPMNSFVKTSKGTFVYQGTINGVALQFRIVPTTVPTMYSLQVDASGMDMSGTTNPVPVKLVIGANSGSVQINDQLQ